AGLALSAQPLPRARELLAAAPDIAARVASGAASWDGIAAALVAAEAE
ncbi:MAG: hypothetical protein H0V44_04820, partial [Planctomycetes bacterium]|nr:hypothetical protein [Planctomycetota bacterium]